MCLIGDVVTSYVNVQKENSLYSRHSQCKVSRVQLAQSTIPGVFPASVNSLALNRRLSSDR